MAWIAVDKNGLAWVYKVKPRRKADSWTCSGCTNFAFGGERSMQILIGRELTWEDEPVEIQEVVNPKKEVDWNKARIDIATNLIPHFVNTTCSMEGDINAAMQYVNALVKRLKKEE